MSPRYLELEFDDAWYRVVLVTRADDAHALVQRCPYGDPVTGVLPPDAAPVALVGEVTMSTPDRAHARALEIVAADVLQRCPRKV